MPGKEVRRRQDNRRGRRLRLVVLAALLAVFTSLMVAGPASADGWPHGGTSGSHQGHK